MADCPPFTIRQNKELSKKGEQCTVSMQPPPKSRSGRFLFLISGLVRGSAA